jgi:uncharacterized protein (DUF3084 family)
MGMSIDYAQLETASQFASFLAIIKNPDAFAKVVEQATKAVADEKALMGPRATVAGADVYKAKVIAEIEDLDAKFLAKTTAWEQDVEKKKKELLQEQSRIADLARDTALKNSEVDALVGEQKKITASLKKDLLDVQTTKEELVKEQVQLKLDKEDLAAKVAQVQQLMGV